MRVETTTRTVRSGDHRERARHAFELDHAGGSCVVAVDLHGHRFIRFDAQAVEIVERAHLPYLAVVPRTEGGTDDPKDRRQRQGGHHGGVETLLEVRPRT